MSLEKNFHQGILKSLFSKINSWIILSIFLTHSESYLRDDFIFWIFWIFWVQKSPHFRSFWLKGPILTILVKKWCKIEFWNKKHLSVGVTGFWYFEDMFLKCYPWVPPSGLHHISGCKHVWWLQVEIHFLSFFQSNLSFVGQTTYRDKT